MGLHLSRQSMSTDEEQEISEINIVPLVDVLLVLLVIFMVAAPISIGGIAVSLPRSESKQTTQVDKKKMILTIDQKGHYYIEKTKVDHDLLRSKLKAIYDLRENKDLYIRADEQVIYGSVVAAMNEARQAGVEKLAMLTQQDSVKKDVKSTK